MLPKPLIPILAPMNKDCFLTEQGIRRPLLHRRRLLVTALIGLPLAASAGTGEFGPPAMAVSASPAGVQPEDSSLPPGLLSARYVLLGEVHDNPDVHRLRLEWLRKLSAVRRFALAMEQLDAALQPQIDEARSDLPARRDARALARAGGFSFEGWQWELYEPVIEFALEAELPLVAANLSAREAMAAARAEGGEAAGSPRPSDWQPVDEAALSKAIRDGHCGLLPEPAVGSMVSAQLARDRAMARAMTEAHRRYGLPVVLLAGNGHVRADIGVPRHLSGLEPGARILSIGVGEQGEAMAGRFDHIAEVAPFARPDPCESLRRRFGDRGG
jgi:uncharacterized iron-regulated protein